MALRTRYGYNCQKTCWGIISQFRSLGYVPVVPGETIHGAITTRVQSAPTLRNVLTRTYLDAWAFYMPYRLADPNWPNFISGVNDTPPTVVTDLWNANFEGRFTGGTIAAAADENNSFQRNMYNMVFRDYFAKNKADIASLTATNILYCLQRPSTFEVAAPVKADPATTVDTSGATLAVDEIRKAFAADQFAKMRSFYGQRYTDYLMAVGVKTPWTLLDEPEKIASASTDLSYRQISASVNSATVDLGFNGGYFSGKITTRLKRTFIPEHGLIGVYACVRADPIADDSPMNPELAFNRREQFWSPEFETNKIQKYANQTLDTNATLLEDVERPAYEHLRKGINENTEITVVGNHIEIMGLAVESELKEKYDATSYDGSFQADVLPTSNQYQMTSDYRLTRNSPVLKHGQQRPLY